MVPAPAGALTRHGQEGVLIESFHGERVSPVDGDRDVMSRVGDDVGLQFLYGFAGPLEAHEHGLAAPDPSRRLIRATIVLSDNDMDDMRKANPADKEGVQGRLHRPGRRERENRNERKDEK